MCAILCTTSIALAAIQTGICGDKVTWSLDTDTGVLTISGTGNMSDLIRKEGRTNVYSNFPAWNDYSSMIKTVIISEGVTSIRKNAFIGCSNLTSVSIPEGITSIGEDAFNGCSSLPSIKIPESVTSIGNNAFRNCNDLQSAEFASIEKFFGIDYGNVYANPIYYAHHLLVNGEEITELTIPNTFTSIGDYAFQGLSNLTAVHIPNSVTSIGKQAFYGCAGLTSVTIPNSVTSIGNQAFWGCSGLTSVTVPESVTSIGFGAFGGCGSLESITLPFVGDKPQTETDTDQSPFGYIFGRTDYEGAMSVFSFPYIYYIPKSLKTVVITGSNYIPNDAFEDCRGLTTITIPNSVTSIGREAFRGCTGLTSVAIPNSVTSIGQSAFDNCSGLTSVTIPNSVTSIGSWAFSGCAGLTSINIPNSVTSIGDMAFNGIANINYTGTASGSPWGAKFANKIVDGDFVYDDTEKTQLAGYIGSSTDVTIPESVTSIREQAFRYCSGLTSVTIPNSVTSIGEQAFYYCIGLTSVTIPNSVTSIGRETFRGCRGLTSVAIPNSVTSIGQSAFDNCSGLTSVTIPNSVTSIGSWAFSGCAGLTSINIPNSVTSIGDMAFNGIANINYTGTASGSPWGAKFANKIVDGDFVYNDAEKTQLAGYVGTNTKVTIPENVVSIDGRPFRYCDSLTKVSIPKSVTEIAEKAFYDCIKLDTVIISKRQLQTINKDAFIVKDGTCGDDARWKYDALTKTLTISGTGRMNDYGYDFDTHTDIETPWVDFADKIESVIVEEGITSMGSSLFDFNKNIKYASLPSTCTNYGSAFNLCRNLQKVVVRARTIMSVNSYSFDNYENCTLYVPMDMVDFYKNEIVFRDFSEIIGAYMVTIDNVANGTISVDSSAILPGGSFTITVSPNEGYRINSVLVNGNAIEKNDTAYLVENVNENLTVSATFSLLKIGKCGENLTWKYDSENQTLTISGTGDMYDYEENKTPWSTLKDKMEISTIVIEDGVTSIGDNAFSCVKATIIEVGATVSKLGKNNFMNYYSKTNGNVTTTTYYSSYVYIYGTEIVDIDDAFSDTFLGGWGTIYVPIKNYAQITDNKVFEGYDIKGLCTITVADSIVNGSISVAKTCIAGNTIDITIMPKTGFKIESVTADGKPIKPTNKNYSLVVDSNIVLSATFKPNEYQISTYSSHGKIKVVETAHYGDTVSFTVEPDKGYKVLYTSVSDINYRDVDMINDSLFVMPAKNVQIAITFEKEEEKDHTAVTETTSNMADIYTSGNKIVVENATEDIFVYNAMGTLICRDTINRARAEISVNTPGVYIVKTGGVVKRVVVN